MKGRRGERGALVSPELMAYLFIAAIVSLIAFYLLSRVRERSAISEMVAEFNRIVDGLYEYKETYGNLPAGDFPEWTPNGEFIEVQIWQNKWSYSCDNSVGEIYITSPPISNARIRAKVQGMLSKTCDGGINVDGNSLVCIITNAYCPSAGGGGGEGGTT